MATAGNASVAVVGAAPGNAFQELLLADDIEPGSDTSYDMCKQIYIYHPLGAKMVDAPIEIAQSQEREISIPNSPEDRVREAFRRKWTDVGADSVIAQTKSLSRTYGIASFGMFTGDDLPGTPVDFATIAQKGVSFNVWDPLNTAGSLVLNQNANARDYQKQGDKLSVAGAAFHQSRTVVVSNGDPIFIAYTNSGFGFVGRSVYQRGLFPLKSFINTMIADDMVAKKAGVMVAKLKSPGSVVSQLMEGIANIKRNLLKDSMTGNVISISSDHNEDITTLDLANVDKALGAARRNILENLAASDNMPAKLLNSETFAEGFGEGTEDAKQVARYIERFRNSMRPLYAYMDKVVQHLAWDEDFYKTIQAEFPTEYGSKQYNQAFYEWVNSFDAKWPSLLIEPDSEKSKTDKVKLEGVTDILNAILPTADPDNKARLLEWVADNVNDMKFMFGNPLVLDYEAMANFVPPPPPGMEGDGDEPGDKKPDKDKKDGGTSRIDSQPSTTGRARQAFLSAAAKLDNRPRLGGSIPRNLLRKD